ncbi:signal peptidase II [Anaerococcus sp. Marseille-P3625]|uniref:signal peptidase II n=1 Tax=Anaerococcus sp. Marseille-P3625 TaxID=1977277 RepID=UPI000C082FCF|nr:signal peptidase II [Anaerococcus sp. Marseille-P3625]
MIYILIIILGLILDRVSKIYAINNFIENPISGKILNFTYLENRGAAFGILQNNRFFFLILTIAIVGFLIYYFIKNYKKNNKFLNIAIAFIIAGALGNFYDRLFNAYVVDFIEFAFVKFPVFNVADIFVTLGSGLLIIYMIFFDQGEKIK